MSHTGLSRRYVTESAAAFVVVVMWTVVIYTRYGGPNVSQAVSNVGLAAVALAGALAGALAARRRRGSNRRVWALLAASAFSWGSGQIIWTWYESVLKQEPFPSLADVGYLGAVPLAAAALLSLPTAAQTLAGRVRAVLDGLMIATSLLLTSWVLVLGPVVEAGGESLLIQAISLAYPIGDVVLATIVVYVLLRTRQQPHARDRFPLRPVGLGLVAIAIADSGFVYLQLTETYASGSLIDAGWFLGYVLLLVAARKPATSVSDDEHTTQEGRPLGILLPYAAVALALATSSVELLRTGSVDHFVSWTRTAIIVLMVMRQILTLLENLSLTRHLEARVAERTAELRASEQRFHALVKHSSDVVTVVDVDSTVVYQSESVHRVFGRDSRELVGKPLTTIFDGASAARLRDGLTEAARESYGMRVLELTLPHQDGKSSEIEITITNLMDDPSVRGLVLNTRDVTERRRLENQLVHEAFHDSLTGLANRALFKDRVERALSRRSRCEDSVAVLFLDLDGFKEINDSLGHAAGDMLLKLVAQRLSDCARASDTVARLGGDEFAVLVDAAGSEQGAPALATRIADALNERFALNGHEIYVRASVGIAAAKCEEDADQLLRNADLAMYRAKAGRDGNYRQYDPSMHSDLVERLELEADLRRALAAKEFVLHYQPMMSLASGEIVGFEALIRWQHPTRGLVFPSTFISAAEHMGLIRPMGVWILREACRQAAVWRQQDLVPESFSMSLNISVCQLQHGDFVADISHALEESGLSPHQLVLEMTESVLMEHTEETLALLKRIKSLGVRLAIDDFGTGYSSLSYLQRFPFDILKIDRSFIDRLTGPSAEGDLVRTIVQLGHSLRMTIVAEGIENYAQFLALRRIGCELGQGYHFSRPAPADEIAPLLSERTVAGEQSYAA
ncbi:MAG: EAL domain-containing protein [Actinomycetota bacterium]|nr:EAL domain-containing protein [Actinomycetota bacterium]